MIFCNHAGFAGGRKYDAHGSGTTTLCLPHNPDPSKFHTSATYSYGVIYGSEYEFNFKNIATNDDVPCAVCYSYQGTSVMIPAKTSCPSQRTKQFAGFLTQWPSWCRIPVHGRRPRVYDRWRETTQRRRQTVLSRAYSVWVPAVSSIPECCYCCLCCMFQIKIYYTCTI